MVVKPPSGVQPPPAAAKPAASQPAKGPAKGAQATTTVVSPEAAAKALKDYQKIRSKLKQPFMKGAAGLFTDNIVFPSELLDPNDPANDPKYLHLLFAVFGLKELERFFATVEQREEEEDLEEEGEKVKKEKKGKKKGKNKGGKK